MAISRGGKWYVSRPRSFVTPWMPAATTPSTRASVFRCPIQPVWYPAVSSVALKRSRSTKVPCAASDVTRYSPKSKDATRFASAPLAARAYSTKSWTRAGRGVSTTYSSSASKSVFSTATDR